jgi:hypothetical protein
MTNGKISILAGIMKHVILVAQAAILIRKMLAENKALAKAHNKTLRILGEKKA